jgi:hypothetical protein
VNTRAIALIGALASTALAEPARKSSPDRYARAAGEAFAAAAQAEDRGDLDAAAHLYAKAYEISPHPSTIFNLAQVQARQGRAFDAAVSYELYLALAGAAPDRAEVERMIAEMLARKQSVELFTSTIDLATAYVIVDGVIALRPGEAKPVQLGGDQRLKVEMAAGVHHVDVVTALSLGSAEVKLAYEGISAPPRVDGNVIAASPEISLAYRGHHLPFFAHRFTADPGRQTLAIYDRTYECAPLSIDVPKNGDVVYAYVAPVELPYLGAANGPERCRKLEYKTLRLTFPP